MTYPRTIARLASVTAAFALVLTSFAPGVSAQQSSASLQAQIQVLLAQVAALQAQLGGSASMTFTRDLTIGASGADVTALQNWLIKGGYAIPAGATGYFGAQTAAALAKYQAANAITPAAGYFGAITRARVNASVVVTPKPSPTPNPDTDDGDDDSDTSRDAADAKDAIEDARDSLADAREEVEDARDDNEDTDDAEDFLDQAEALLDDADEALDDKDYEEVADLVEEAEDFIEDALDEIDANRNDEDEDNGVSTRATVNDRDGANNDFATFSVGFDLEAFRTDVYIDRDADVSIEYEIQDAQGNAVTGQDSESVSLRSSADEDNGYYILREDTEENFTLTVTFDPLAADEGEQYRLQFLGINYSNDESAPNRVWNASPESRYQTDYVYIGD